MMIKTNYFLILLFLLPIFLNACQSIKDGLSGKKSENSDEFLVQKKNALVVPNRTSNSRIDSPTQPESSKNNQPYVTIWPKINQHASNIVLPASNNAKIWKKKRLRPAVKAA